MDQILSPFVCDNEQNRTKKKITSPKTYIFNLWFFESLYFCVWLCALKISYIQHTHGCSSIVRSFFLSFFIWFVMAYCTMYNVHTQHMHMIWQINWKCGIRIADKLFRRLKNSNWTYKIQRYKCIHTINSFKTVSIALQNVHMPIKWMNFRISIRLNYKKNQWMHGLKSNELLICNNSNNYDSSNSNDNNE